MATEKEANQARDAHASLLKRLGVHSIGVDQVEQNGKKTFAVIAYLEKARELPTDLEISSGQKKKKVPLVQKIAGAFKPE